MSVGTQDFLEDLSLTLLSGDTSVVDIHFGFPFSIFVENEVLVLANPMVLHEGLTDFIDLLRRHDIASATPRVLATGLPRMGRFLIWADWTFRTSDGADLGINRVRYILRETGIPQKPVIELADFAGPVLPQLGNGPPVARIF